MTDIDWTLVGVIVSIVGIIVAIIIGYWQIKKGNKTKQNKTDMIQNVKQEVHIHPPEIKPDKKVKKKKTTVKMEKDDKKKEPKMKTIFDDKIIVEAGWYEQLSFELNKGDKIKGIAYETENEIFDCYIVNESQYANYLKKEVFRWLKMYEDDSSIHFDIVIPEHDMWYFVFDLYGKQNDREIQVTLRKVS